MDNYGVFSVDPMSPVVMCAAFCVCRHECGWSFPTFRQIWKGGGHLHTERSEVLLVPFVMSSRWSFSWSFCLYCYLGLAFSVHLDIVLCCGSCRTGESRGFAFVRYKYADEAQKAIERLDGKIPPLGYTHASPGKGKPSDIAKTSWNRIIGRKCCP